MTKDEYAMRIGAQADAATIQALIQSFAAQSVEFDKCKVELAALKAKYEPKEAAVPAMAEGGEK